MIIVKMQGGLGNQLFQYAAGRSRAAGLGTSLKLDISGYAKRNDGATARSYRLNCFRIEAGIATDEEVNSLRGRGTLALVEKLKPFRWRHYIKENQFHFDPRIRFISNDVYLDGYWQSEKYFKDIENIIRREIVLKTPLEHKYQALLTSMRSPLSVSIHVRRGDYVSSAAAARVHGVCPPEYYSRALEAVQKVVKQPRLFVFSDDINWVKENISLAGLSATYVSGDVEMRDYEEIFLMSMCRHNIIANSSFSWWGAWLNRNPDKIVIAPERWFTDPSLNTKDLIPESWLRL